MYETGVNNLYFHVPFCRSKCLYCDFNSYAGMEQVIPRYASTMELELKTWAIARPWSLGRSHISSIYFGGGTPVLLGAERVRKLLEATRASFEVDAAPEVTVEANPGLIDKESLEGLLQAGINRLSVGVQSLDDKELRLLGRIHTASEARAALGAATSAGISNISIDLIYGLPGQRVETWRNTLEEAISLSPAHLSAYALTLEEGTPLAEAVRSGLLPEPDPDTAADMYLMAEELLSSAGYEHYEISNWARPGRECRHNLDCWHGRPYLGLGAGAHSYVASYRFSNIRLPLEYMEYLESGRRPQRMIAPGLGPWGDAAREGLPIDTMEHITERTAMAETMMLSLRLSEGVLADDFARRFGRPVYEVYGKEIEDLIRLGLVSGDGQGIRLTPRGRLLGNQVFCRFFT